MKEQPEVMKCLSELPILQRMSECKYWIYLELR